MSTKPYKANRKQFVGWTTHALQEELNRIEELLKNPDQNATTPDFRKSKDPMVALKFKRMREELMADGYWKMSSVARWSELGLVETYKALENKRKTDPSLPRKPVYPETTVRRPQQTFTLGQASAQTSATHKQHKRQKEMSKAEQKEIC